MLSPERTQAVAKPSPNGATTAPPLRSGPPLPVAPAVRSTGRTMQLLWVVARRQLSLTRLVFERELRELLVSRSLWAMVLVAAPLVGFSFIQAVQLYSGASQSALRLPQLAANLSPLDGIIVPTFSAVYLMNTFLLPFVAIRAIGGDKQTGGLKLLLQLPVGTNRLIAIKLAALGVGWTIALIPVLSALAIWGLFLGGHVYLPELASVLIGHALYAFVIIGFAFLAASLTESAATAAILTLTFTLGAWVLEFASSSGSNLVRAIAAFSLSPALRGMERGLVGFPTALTLLVLGLGFLALTVVWLPPGVSRRLKLLRTGAVVGVAAQALLLVVQLPLFMDVSEDRRNSFNPADERALRDMSRELRVNVNLATNDSRLRDLDRQVLSKLQRAMPQVTVNYTETSTSSLLGGTAGANYGTTTYTYGGRQVTTRATTAREVLPLIHALAGVRVVPDSVAIYSGYPLVTDASAAGVWFYMLLPALAVAGWWWNQRPPGVSRYAASMRSARWTRFDSRFGQLGRVVVIGGAALLVVQLVPYGRDHANLAVSAPADAALQTCQATVTDVESTTQLGTLRQQVGEQVPVLAGVAQGLSSGNLPAARAQFQQFGASFNAMLRDLNALYPGRCPRLLEERDEATSLLAVGNLPAASSSALAIQAGLISIAQDLDLRIRQDSPNEFVGEQLPETTTPSVTGVPPWPSPRTQELATRACAACHSNQPVWPWYTNLAPVSWLVQREVDNGRGVLNFSEWDQVQPGASRAGLSAYSGDMPPEHVMFILSGLELTDSERLELATGLAATMGGVRAAPPPPVEDDDLASGPPPLLWLLAGALLVAGGLLLRPRTMRTFSL